MSVGDSRFAHGIDRAIESATDSGIDRALDRMSKSAAFDAYDIALVRLLKRLDASAPLSVLGAAAIASSAIRTGDVCISLRELAEQPLFDDGPIAPHLEAWRAALRASILVCAPGGRAPLVLDHVDRLYLHRYHNYETRLAVALRERGADRTDVIDQRLLDRWFAADAKVGADPLQRAAVTRAYEHRFAVIAGGPGTGKTMTVARLLGILLDHYGPTFKIRVAAPTGKAAARLQQALGTAWTSLERLADGTPTKLPAPPTAQTVHRLLGTRPHSTSFKHDRDNPLAADCVVVDEASMLDLALATKLVEAVPHHARLILLGDPDQLSSVEAGAVMSSLAGGALGAAVTTLTRSYRFNDAGEIGRLAHAIRAGELATATQLLASGGADVEHLAPSTEVLLARLGEGYAPYAEAVRTYLDVGDGGGDITRVFTQFAAFRVLCATRSGPLGTRALNRAAERVMLATVRANITDHRTDDRTETRADQSWYHGRAVMVSANDYGLALFNGDVGICLLAPDGSLRVWFERDNAVSTASAVPTAIAVAHMPACESAFAMTVHKSQGSEFAQVLITLPAAPNRALSRELLYTAVTRASHRVTLMASDAALMQAVNHRRVRRSGLAEQLAARLAD